MCRRNQYKNVYVEGDLINMRALFLFNAKNKSNFFKLLISAGFLLYFFGEIPVVCGIHDITTAAWQGKQHALAVGL